AEDVAFLDDDVTDIDAHAKFDAAPRGHLRVALGHAALYLDSAAHGVDDARECNQRAVAGGLDDAAAMLGHFRLEEGAAIHLQVAQRAFLALAHQPRIAGDIGRQDGCQLALHPFPAHRLTGPEREAAPQSRTERDLTRGLVRATAFLERNKR